MATIARNSCGNPFIREALISGLVVRELEFMERLLGDKDWLENRPGRSELLSGLAQCVFTERKARRVDRLFELAARESSATAWRRLAVLDGMIATLPRFPARSNRRGRQIVKPKPVRFEAQPPAWAVLMKVNDPRVRDRMKSLTEVVTWPGQPGYQPPPPPTFH